MARVQIRKDNLNAAEESLRSAIQTAESDADRCRAQGLNYVQARLAPTARMLEAARDLESMHPTDFKQSLTDYRLLYDKLSDKIRPATCAASSSAAALKDPLEEIALHDDLAAWLS